MHITNKANFRNAVAVTIRDIAKSGDANKNRSFRAAQKAAEEIKANDTMRFDAATGQLSFVSTESGKPRRVTRFGCTRECDCLNSVSYHRYVFEIVSRYTEANNKTAPNVLYFPMKNSTRNSTVLTYAENDVTTSLCRNCGETESISENAPAADLKRHRRFVAARHADCFDRTPHPQIAAHLAKRVAAIEARTFRQELAVESSDLFYETPDSWNYDYSPAAFAA